MNVLKTLFSKTMLVIVGVVALAALVYVGTSMLHDGDPQGFAFLTTPFRMLLGIVVLLAAAFAAVLIRMQTATRSLLIEQSLQRSGREQVDLARPDQRGKAEAVESRFNEGLGALKSSRLGKGALYSLPWYVIIGPPGSGKTTMLHESGLTFLLDHKRGIRGIGGTRNCDWFFTKEGILLDTAGRYTTEVEDHDEWLEFLGLLKQSRRDKALNGVIVAMSVGDLLTSRSDEVDAHAERIRERIDELSRELELALPVYLLFTKADLVEGFVEFFGSLDRTERAQIWGTTIDVDDERTPDQVFGGELELLEQHLETRRSRLLALDSPLRRQQRIYSFPIQFRSLRSRLLRFLEMVVQPNPYHEPARLRGVYFTSGTQEGNPIDQVMSRMRVELGLPAAADAEAREDVPPNAYFIESLFRDVVFEDRNLATESALARTRARRRRVGAIAAIAVGAVACILLLWRSHVELRDELAAVTAAAPVALETLRTDDDPLSSTVLDALDALDGVQVSSHVIANGSALPRAAAARVDEYVTGTLWPTIVRRAESFTGQALDRCGSALADARIKGLEDGKQYAEDNAGPLLQKSTITLDAVQQLASGDGAWNATVKEALGIDGEASMARIRTRLRAALAGLKSRTPPLDGDSLLVLAGPTGGRPQVAHQSLRQRETTLRHELEALGATAPANPLEVPSEITTRDQIRTELRGDAEARWSNFLSALGAVSTDPGGARRSPADALNALDAGFDPGGVNSSIRDQWLNCVSFAFEVTRKEPRGVASLTLRAGRKGNLLPPPGHGEREALLFGLIRKARDLVRDPENSFRIVDGSSPALALLTELTAARENPLLKSSPVDAEAADQAGWTAYQEYIVNGATRILERVETAVVDGALAYVDQRWQPLKVRLDQAYARYPFDRGAPIDENLSVDEFAALFGPDGEVARFAATLDSLEKNGLGPTVHVQRTPELSGLVAWQRRAADTFFSDGGRSPFVMLVVEAGPIAQDVAFRDPKNALQHVDLDFGTGSWKTSLAPRAREQRLRWDSSADRARIEFRRRRGDASTERTAGEIIEIEKGPWSLFRLFDDRRWALGNDLARELPSDSNSRGVFEFEIPGAEPTAIWTVRIETYGGKPEEPVKVDNPLKNDFFAHPDLPTHAVRSGN